MKRESHVASWALLITTLLALVAVSVVELFEVPARIYSQTLWHVPRLFFLTCAGNAKHLMVPMWFLFWLGLLRAHFPTGTRWHRWAVVLVILLSVALALAGYHTLISYERFEGHIPLMLLFALLGIAVAGMALFFMWPPTRPFPGWSAKPYQWAFASLFLALGIVMHVLNKLLFRQTYPTLHLSVLQLSFALMSGGLAVLLYRLVPRNAWPRQWIRRLLGVVAVHLLVLCWLPFSPEWAAASRSLYARFTLPGQADSLAVDQLEKLTRSAEANAADLAPASDGVDIFKEMSGMPELPPNFRLNNYNVLWITVEALRYDQTSLFDPKRNTTPRLLQLLHDEGAFVFDSAWSPSIRTMVVVSSMLAMTYPAFTKIHLSRNTIFGTLDKSELRVSDLFRGAGYRTFRVTHNISSVFEKRNHGLGQGFDVNKLVCPSTLDPDCDLEISQEAAQAIDGVRGDKKPFFGWVFFSSPHAPYLAHYPDMPDKTDMDRFRQEIRFSDEQIGFLVDRLKSTGQWNKAILIVMGDHGDECKEHGRQYHDSLYQEVARVAMLVRIPKVAGHRVTRPVSSLYTFPWLLAQGSPTLSWAAQERMRSDLGPVMMLTDGAVFSEILGTSRSEVALVHGSYRLHANLVSQSFELFNLEKDMGEQHDIFHTDTAAAQKLQKLLDNYLRIREARTRIVYAPTPKPAVKAGDKKNTDAKGAKAAQKPAPRKTPQRKDGLPSGSATPVNPPPAPQAPSPVSNDTPHQHGGKP